MPAKSATLANDWLKLLYNAVAIANLADNAASSPVTTIYVALHVGAPSGTQDSNEAAYTGYARVSVARTTSGWTVSGGSVSPVANIVFPTGTGGTGTATYWSTGTGASGATKMLHYGPISPTISLGSGVTPSLTTATTITEN